LEKLTKTAPMASTPQRPDVAPKSPQFGVRMLSLFVVVVVMMIVGLATGSDSLFTAAYLLASGAVMCLAVWTIATKRKGVVGYLLGLTAILLLIGLIDFGPSPAARENAWRATCLNNLKNIGIALRNYATAHNALPAVYTQGRDGKPLTSWRTRILPYLERTDVYAAYSQFHPWDSPENKVAVNAALDLFRCPSAFAPKTPQTNYLAVIAPDSAWQPGKKTTMSDITDNHADTILLIEFKDSDIPWAEPRDLDLDHLPEGLTQQNLLQSLSNHPGVFNALFADGHVETLPATIPWSDFLAMLTIAGGETIDRKQW
jgi:prepilin-type processing-associated H-X9-DG protein